MGIIYGGFGWHAAGVPQCGQFVQVLVSTPGDLAVRHEDAWFALVTEVIAGLGWTS